MTADCDFAFVGSIPSIYDEHLVPLIFQPYAVEVARRVASGSPSHVLEVAAGTGVVTRALASTLPRGVSVVATDLNPAMLDRAASVGTSRPVEWRRADAMELPFADRSFDVVVCQFGVMFFPNKPRAFAELRRVLRVGSVLLFSVWDRIEENEFAEAVTAALGDVFPADPPRFLPRTPHGYSDAGVVTQDLRGGGFAAEPVVETVAARSRAASARIPAVAYCLGTPLRNEIETRDPAMLEPAVGACERAIARRFGHGSVDSKIQAHIFSVTRSATSHETV